MKKAGRILISLSFWLAVWAGAALAMDKELLLPAPWAVCARLFALAQTASFWRVTGLSLLRIVVGIFIGVAGGCLCAYVCAKVPLADSILSPFMTVIRSTPVASFIILALIWIGRDSLPTFIAVLMVLPVIDGNMVTGIRRVNNSYLEVAKVFHFSPLRRFARVTLPSVMPYFLSACRTSLGLAWKAGIAAEVLTVPKNSIGKMLYESKLNLETVDLFAWTAVVILLSLLIEKLMNLLFARLGRAFRFAKMTEEGGQTEA